MSHADKVKADKLTKNAFDCIEKIPAARQALEQNLILSIVHKVFKKVDQRVAKRFNVLAALINKIKPISLKEGDVLVQPDEAIDKIYIMYSGQVE